MYMQFNALLKKIRITDIKVNKVIKIWYLLVSIPNAIPGFSMKINRTYSPKIFIFEKKRLLSIQ